MGSMTVKLASLGAYRVDSINNRVITITERFKGLSEIDKDYKEIITNDLPHILKQPGLFSALVNNYYISHKGLLLKWVVPCREDYLPYKYDLVLWFDKSLFFKNLKLIAVRNWYSVDVRGNYNDARTLRDYIESEGAGLARKWIKECMIGMDTMYRNSDKLLDYINCNLIWNKYFELYS